jgi:hypothetical protein
MEDDRSIMRGTGQGLLEFCDRAATRGDMDAGRAKAMRSTSRRILEVESADLDAINLRELDVDDLLDRFGKLKKADYSDGSLKTYQSRFRSVVSMYLAWLDDDPNWKAGGPTRKPTPSSNGSPRKGSSRRSRQPAARERPAEESAETTARDTPPMVQPPGTQLLTYDVPLRPDLIVRVTLPIDLTDADAERFCAFVRSLAFSGRVGGPETDQVEGDE